MAETSKQWWSWQDVLAAARRLGIPHFQRGQVWETANRVALLESMYHASPCGLFVVWKPDAEAARGDLGVSILTDERASGQDMRWLVDGQQRCRTLISIARDCLVAEQTTSARRPPLVPQETLSTLSEALEAPEDAGEEEPEDDESNPGLHEKGAPCWYVSIPALLPIAPGVPPWLKKLATAPRIARYSAFRTFRPGALIGPRSVAPEGLLPLALFMANVEPFTPEHVATLRDHIQNERITELQRAAPWAALWLTGQADGALNTSADLAHLEEWLKALQDEFASGTPGPLRSTISKLHGVFVGKRFGVDDLPSSDVAHAVAAYVRINRAGVRVQAEERAMAVLLRWHPGFLDDLASFLAKRDGLEVATASRRHLSHASDKIFGFGLWTQVVARYSILALFPKKEGVKWLGVDSIEKWTVAQRLEALGAETTTRNELRVQLAAAAALASSALLLVDSLLSKELFLDHRMARSEVRQLWPMLELLQRLQPDDLTSLCNTNHVVRPALARLLQLTMVLGYIDQAALLAFTQTLHEVPLPTPEAMAPLQDRLGPLLKAYVLSLAEIHKDDQNAPVRKPGMRPFEFLGVRALEAFSLLVRDARSLQHPAVGWLYAIERRGEATDFAWDRQRTAFLESKERGIESRPDVSEAIKLEALMYPGRLSSSPQKQHVVPFSDARVITGKGGTRATASRANDLGNLTWISGLQNGLEQGFSNRWMVLDPNSDAKNLEARGFLHQEADSPETPLELFERLFQSVKVELPQPRKESEHLYSRFCELRRSWMVRQMGDWIEKPLPQPSMALIQA